jgi:hypothetical protein
MERNVNSFRVAIKKGYSPCLYSYGATQIPLGEFDTRLDLKTGRRELLPSIVILQKLIQEILLL